MTKVVYTSVMEAKKAICPKCGAKMWKQGFNTQNLAGDRKQKYACSKCRHITVNPGWDTG